MEESLPIQEPQPEAPKQPSMSLPARLLNVFAVPGDVFADIKAAPASTANWIVPVIISAVVGALCAIVIFSQPAIQQQLREMQSKAMEQKVKAGKLTRAQADQFSAIAEKFTQPGILKMFGACGAAVGSLIRVLWWALVLWLLGRWFLKAPFGYNKTLEVTGLALMISVLGAIVTVLLTVNLGRMFATPSLALALSDFDTARKGHLMAAAVNVFSLWQVGVMAVGLARLAGVAFLPAAWLVFAYWIAQQMFLIFTGLGQFGM
jgi:hypothetical protein